MTGECPDGSKDACGVCFGDSTSCTGVRCDNYFVPSDEIRPQCDEVPYSNISVWNKTTDACGLCGGNNATCWGCDGT